jgi:hypothetical protein
MRLLYTLSIFILFSCGDSKQTQEEILTVNDENDAEVKTEQAPNCNEIGGVQEMEAWVPDSYTGLAKTCDEIEGVSRVLWYATYSNGEKNGIEKTYHPNGSLHWVANYIHGNREGEVKYYHYTGELKQITQFINGEEEGESLGYWENGNLRSKGVFRNGEKEGVWEYYYEEGPLKKKVTYKEGIEVR